jgi:hypothetical protein
MRVFTSAVTGVILSATFLTASVPVQQATGPKAPATQTGKPVSLAGCVLTELDYARTSGLAPTRDSAESRFVLLEGSIAYSLTGRAASGLGKHVNNGVEIVGVVENVQPRAPAVANGGGTEPSNSGSSGVTPQGSPAHEPGDATSGAGNVAPTNNADALSPPGRPIATRELPRINVSAVRALDVRCAETPPAPTATLPPASTDAKVGAPDAAAVTAPVTETITATGCLISQPDSGRSARNGARERDGELVLTKATVAAARRDGSSAVPGSPPSSSDTGTVGTTRQSSPPSVSEEVGFRLSAVPADLANHLGRRVQIVGTVTHGEVLSQKADVAHTSAATLTLMVESFRPIAGSCF